MRFPLRALPLAAVLALAFPGTGHAMEQTIKTGYNDGTKGVFNLVYGVNVPGVERAGQPRTYGLVGECEYVPGTGVDTDHLPIVVETHAAAAPSWDFAAAISTSVQCEVVGPGSTVLATGATAGGATVAVGLGQVTLQDLGELSICITLSARFTDTSFVTSGRVCAPPDGIVGIGR